MNNKSKQKTISATETIKFCIKWAMKYPWMVVAMLVPVILTSSQFIFIPYLTKRIINIATDTNSNQLADKIFPVAMWFIIALLAWETCWRVYSYIVDIRSMPLLRKSIMMDSVDKLFGKSSRYYQDNMSGSITKRIMDLSDEPLELIKLIFNRFLIKLGILLGTIILLWNTKAEFACIIILWTILFAVIFTILFPRIIKNSRDFSSQGTLINGQVNDCFSNMTSIRLFANWDLEKKILDHSTQEAIFKEQKKEKIYLILFTVVSYSFVFLQAIALYLLVKYKIEDSITVGDFAMVLTLNYNVVESMWYFMFELMDFTKHLGKTQQALKDIFAKVEVLDEKNAKDLVVKNGEIKFKNVYFRYNDTVENTFENFSCIIRPGQKVGLVGESGAGKTSFVNLLLRTYDIQQGEIIIDKQNIAKFTQDSLHKNIGVIPQDPSLFHRTIFENIQYGDPQKSEAEVYEAAKNASAHEFILSTPEGYKSLVGERGVKISGGQRQRIAIARAFLKNAPILILDEATSALDSVTEREIQITLWNLMKDKTCIVVAHRLSTLVDMDRILVFDEGGIVQDGTHAELSKINGIYRNLWDTQVNGFIMVD